MHVVPVEGLTTRSADINNEGVLDYAEEGGEVADLFGDFCRRSLCGESWDFILDTVAYKVPSSFSVYQLSDATVFIKDVSARSKKSSTSRGHPKGGSPCVSARWGYLRLIPAWQHFEYIFCGETDVLYYRARLVKSIYTVRLKLLGV